MREGCQFFSIDLTMYRTKYKLLALNTFLRTSIGREWSFYRDNMISILIIYRILRYPINPNRGVPEACVGLRRPSNPRSIFEGCLERFAWFAPKSEGCLEQNAFRESLFFQKRGMSRAKPLFYKPILTLNGKRGKNKKYETFWSSRVLLILYASDEESLRTSVYV